MVKKLQRTNADKKTGPQLSSAVKDSAQQIWLAGLGAFSKAQEEGSKVFNALVKEGMAIQHKTKTAAEGNFSEATSRISDIVNDLASDIQSRAGNRWDKLEKIFDERVAKAHVRLGVPSVHEMAALADRVTQLEKQLQAVGGQFASDRPTARSVPRAARKVSASPAPAAKEAVRPVLKRAAKAARPSTDQGDGPAQSTTK